MNFDHHSSIPVFHLSIVALGNIDSLVKEIASCV